MPFALPAVAGQRLLIALSLVAASACSDAVGRVTAPAPTEPSTPATGGSATDTSRTAPPPAVPASPDTTATPPSAPTGGPSAPTGGSGMSTFSLYVEPTSSARSTADAWRATRPADAAMLDKIAAQPQARWLGNWNADITAAARAAVAAASGVGAAPVLVAYNIPQRDCGGFSGGNNSMSPSTYRQWIDALATGIGSARAIVILEPDALAAMGCLSAADQQTRTDLIRYAITALKKGLNTLVYVDAGHPRWQSPATMATRLVAAGIGMADGFSLNISNFITDADNVAYGALLSARIGDKHFVIDASRNGLGPTPTLEWCNPAGRALGRRPTVNTGHPLVDAFLWIKRPGESDGNCNGDPAAGVWMPEYALGLASRASY